MQLRLLGRHHGDGSQHPVRGPLGYGAVTPLRSETSRPRIDGDGADNEEKKWDRRHTIA